MSSCRCFNFIERKHWIYGFSFVLRTRTSRISQVYEKSANRPAPAGLGSWDFYSKRQKCTGMYELIDRAKKIAYI